MSDWPEGWYREEAGQRGYQAGGPAEPPTAGRGVPSAWPAQPPPVSAPLPGVPGAPGLPYPGPGRRTGGRRWRFWGQPGRRGRRISLIAGTVVAVLIAATAGSYFWLDGKLNRTVALPAFAGQSAGQNWLIVGADSRQGLTDKQIVSLHLGFISGTENSDSLMLLHMGTGRPVLISIPRDSYVPIPGHGDNKINAALGFGGPTLLIQTVEDLTGLRINHYMGIGFGGLVSVVNEVGGVRICLPAPLHDKYSGLNLTAGCHDLNGAQALSFVRDRHSFVTEDSAISVDQGTHLYDLAQVALALRDPQTGTVPVAHANYLTSNAGDALLWNRTQALQLFNALKNGKAVPPGLLNGTTIG
jgi:LCP family protein required for cell wall assembly